MNIDVVIFEKTVPAKWRPGIKPGTQEARKQVGIKVPLWYYSNS